MKRFLFASLFLVLVPNVTGFASDNQGNIEPNYSQNELYDLIGDPTIISQSEDLYTEALKLISEVGKSRNHEGSLLLSELRTMRIKVTKRTIVLRSLLDSMRAKKDSLSKAEPSIFNALCGDISGCGISENNNLNYKIVDSLTAKDVSNSLGNLEDFLDRLDGRAVDTDEKISILKLKRQEISEKGSAPGTDLEKLDIRIKAYERRISKDKELLEARAKNFEALKAKQASLEADRIRKVSIIDGWIARGMPHQGGLMKL